MRKTLLTTVALMAFTPLAAFAELSTDDIVALFPGAQKIEIKRGLTQTKVEVYVNGEKIEVVYDNATDEEVKRETETLSEEQSSALKIEIEEYHAGEDDEDDEDEDEFEDDDDHDDDGTDESDDDDEEDDDDESDDDDHDDDHGDDDDGDDESDDD